MPPDPYDLEAAVRRGLSAGQEPIDPRLIVELDMGAGPQSLHAATGAVFVLLGIAQALREVVGTLGDLSGALSLLLATDQEAASTQAEIRGELEKLNATLEPFARRFGGEGKGLRGLLG